MIPSATQPISELHEITGVDVPRYRILEIAIILLWFIGFLGIGLGFIFVICTLIVEGPNGFARNITTELSLVIGGVVNLVISQFLECIRDMARNSFYIRRGLTVVGYLTNKEG